MAITPLSADEIDAAMRDVPQWRYDSDAQKLSRTWQFKNFAEAWAFLSHVAALAEAHNHHPDIFNSYGQVTLMLTTHDCGGVSSRDIHFARALQKDE